MDNTDDKLQDDLDNLSEREHSPELEDNSSNEDENQALNYSQNSKEAAPRKGGLAKKFGPVGLVALILAIIIIGFSVTMTPAIAINHFAEAISGSFNYQEDFMPERIKQTIWLQLGRSAAVKVADTVEALTLRQDRIFNPEPNVIKRFKKDGIEVGKNADGSSFMKYDGKTLSVDDFQAKYYQDRSFRKTVNHASRGQLGRMFDSVATKVKSKFKVTGLKIKKLIKGKQFSETADDSIDDIVNGKTKVDLEDPLAKIDPEKKIIKTQDGIENAEKTIIDTLDADPIDSKPKFRRKQISTKFASTMARTIGTLADAGESINTICSIYNTAILANSFAKIFNKQQLIRFAYIFLEAADSIKAGVASEELVSHIGNILLSMVPTKLPSGETTISTALDSTGFIYASQGVLNGEINQVENPNATKYQNASTGALAGLISQLKKNNIVVSTCNFAVKNKIGVWTSIASIGAAVVLATIAVLFPPIGVTSMAALGSLLVSAIPNIIVGVGLSFAIDEISRLISDAYASTVAGISVSSDTKGGEAGEAVVSGSGALLTDVASSSGGGLLDKSAALQAATYRRHMVAQHAADERAEKSPFDVSSPYTFLGSIIYKAWPYRSKAATTMGKIKSLFSFAHSSINSILPSSEAMAYASDSLALDQCPDADYQDLKWKSENGVEYKAAFDIYCNPIHGIPIGALFDKSGAELAGLLDLPSMMVADTKGNTSPEGYVGEYFTPDMVNLFFSKFKFGNDQLAIQDCGIIQNKKNPLFNYYKNCVNRGQTPYGSIFSQEAGEEDINEFSKTIASNDGTLSAGEDCILTSESLIEPSANGRDLASITPDDYTTNGKRVMFALLFTDERSINILKDEGYGSTSPSEAREVGPSRKIEDSMLDEYVLVRSKEDIFKMRAKVRRSGLYQGAFKSDEFFMDGGTQIFYQSACDRFAVHHARGMQGCFGENFENMNVSAIENYGSGNCPAGKQLNKQKLYPLQTSDYANDPSRRDILRDIYNAVTSGNACRIRASQKDNPESNRGRHFVTVIGFDKRVQSADDLQESDLLIFDSANGQIIDFGRPGTRYFHFGKYNGGNEWAAQCGGAETTGDSGSGGGSTGSGPSGLASSSLGIKLGLCQIEQSTGGGGSGGSVSGEVPDGNSQGDVEGGWREGSCEQVKSKLALNEWCTELVGKNKHFRGFQGGKKDTPPKISLSVGESLKLRTYINEETNNNADIIYKNIISAGSDYNVWNNYFGTFRDVDKADCDEGEYEFCKTTFKPGKSCTMVDWPKRPITWGVTAKQETNSSSTITMTMKIRVNETIRSRIETGGCELKYMPEVHVTSVKPAKPGATGTPGTFQKLDGINAYIYLPENKNANMKVYLAGSGETGEGVLKYGLPRIVKESGSNQIVLVPTKTDSLWNTAAVVNTINATFPILALKGYNVAGLYGDGFSAGGQGLAAVVASGNVRRQFSTIRLFGCDTGKGGLNKADKLLDLLRTGRLGSVRFYVGSSDGKFLERAKADYQKLSSHPNASITIVPGVGHQIDALYNYVGR